jgi:hypothetical protein
MRSPPCAAGGWGSSPCSPRYSFFITEGANTQEILLGPELRPFGSFAEGLRARRVHGPGGGAGANWSHPGHQLREHRTARPRERLTSGAKDGTSQGPRTAPPLCRPLLGLIQIASRRCLSSCGAGRGAHPGDGPADGPDGARGSGRLCVGRCAAAWREPVVGTSRPPPRAGRAPHPLRPVARAGARALQALPERSAMCRDPQIGERPLRE